MRVFLTGSDGYLGSLLAPELMRRGHEVIGLDTGYYKERMLYRRGDRSPSTLVKDIRELESADLQGCDAVVHMAELSNDPAGQLAPHITYEINHKGSVRLAELARKAGVQRFVYMSSCSVYGVSGGDFVTEESPVNPQTAYGICKTLVERDVRALANAQFAPTFLRNATAYGASPRMRFDIVLNNLAGLAWTTKEIRMTSDGTPWRPIVHGLDISQAIIAVLEAPREAVANEVFNVGDTEHNYRVKEIAEIVGEVFPGCTVSFGPPKYRQPELPRVIRQDPKAPSDLQMSLGCQTWSPAASRAVQTSRNDGRSVPVSGIHPSQAARILDPDAPDRRQFLLDKIMRFTATKLEGACIIEPEPHEDSRGLFARTYCAREFREHGLVDTFVQCNTSWNALQGYCPRAPLPASAVIRSQAGPVHGRRVMGCDRRSPSGLTNIFATRCR